MRIRQALRLLPENLPGLRPFRNFQILVALQRRHFDLRAQRRLRKTDRNLANQIRPAPLEKRVLLHFQKNIKIPRRPAIDPRLALPLHPQTRPRIHAGRHAHFQRAFALDAPLPAAIQARILNHLPRALACRACPRN